MTTQSDRYIHFLLYNGLSINRAYAVARFIEARLTETGCGIYQTEQRTSLLRLWIYSMTSLTAQDENKFTKTNCAE
jgi:hypothetical protein